MKKTPAIIVTSLAAVLFFSGIASAHVTVSPKETTQGSYEVFTVRVPTEKQVPTVKVEVKFPDGVDISRFEPKPGWKYDLEKDGTGKINGVVWTATGEGLSATEFGDFKMNGKVGDKATQLSWKAYQTYKDGSVVEWVGAEGSDKPASVTKVNPKTANVPADNHGAATPAVSQPQEQKSETSNVPLILSIVALVAGLGSLFVSLKKK